MLVADGGKDFVYHVDHDMLIACRALADVIVRTHWKGTTLYLQVPVLNQGLDNLYKLVQVLKRNLREH